MIGKEKSKEMIPNNEYDGIAKGKTNKVIIIQNNS